ncbi:MAG: type I-B CRISPR-associated protein Cas7/Csh2 [Spirochaetales bacterium]|nr:type I-B CRISPR-associated protein Cas7/Csh2 [Spirochaetales bacterium]
MSEIIKNRSEILFLYDVKDGNPNGDPLDENKPRIDEEKGINIVTDVRLKRTIRDYFFNYKGYNDEKVKDIFVREKTSTSKKEGLQDAKERAADFKADAKAILTKCIDIRLFGGVIPLEKDSITYTGPVQFKIGRSLHKVELKHIKGTGAFASKPGAKQKTFREEYILPYSLIAFYGVINENAAQFTQLTGDDVELLKEAIWMGTKNLLTRSKMLHTPRLLLIIEYNDPGFFLGELDNSITHIQKEGLRDEQLRDISDLQIDCSKLYENINTSQKKIKSIYIKKDERIQLINFDLEKNKEISSKLRNQ